MISLKEAKKKLKRIKKNVRGLTQQRQAIEALLNDLELFPSRFCKGFAQPVWFMDESPFTVNIIKNHPLNLRVSHYHVDFDKFEPYVQGMKDLEDCEKELREKKIFYKELTTYGDLEDCEKELREKKIFYKELTTYGDLEDVFRLMYMNKWFSEPESESSIQVTE